MGVLDRLQRYGYGEVHFCRDASTQLQALVAVHDIRLGPALGGCRFIHYDREEDALEDALRLARAMTAKAALCGVAHGGGKAVILKPRGDYDRERLFESFGRFVDGLAGRYITTEDSGVSVDDMVVVRRSTRYAVGLPLTAGGSGDPSPLTALGVRRGIEACVAHGMGRRDLAGVHVAVQGIGHVGFALCRELHALGARLSVADVAPAAVQRAVDEFGATPVDNHEIHRIACDVFAPCALGGAIGPQSLPQLNCRVVAGAANNQLVDDAAGEALYARGILYAPDYAINAGGLINVAEEVRGYQAERARERTLAIYDTIQSILERSAAEQQPPHRIADALVEERLAACGSSPSHDQPQGETVELNDPG